MSCSSSASSRRSACSGDSSGSSAPPGAIQTPGSPGSTNRWRKMRLRRSSKIARAAGRTTGRLARASSWNQWSRSVQGTAAFAGDVDGKTKSLVCGPSVRSCTPSGGRCLNAPRYASLPTNASQRARSPLQSVRAVRRCRRSRRREGRRSPAWCGARRSSRRPRRRGVPLLRRRQQPAREARLVQQPPEVVARIREVSARRGGHSTRIDPAEEHAEMPRRGRPGSRSARRSRSLFSPALSFSPAPRGDDRAPHDQRYATFCDAWVPRSCRMCADSTRRSDAGCRARPLRPRARGASRRSSKRRRSCSPVSRTTIRERRGSSRITRTSSPPPP